MQVTPTHGALGAVVADIDLSQPLADGQQHELLAAFAQHQVLVFPEQSLSPDDLLRLAQYFGRVAQYPYAADLEGYPGVTEVRKEKDDVVNFGGVWHSDTTYTEHPPIASMLYSREVPERGGDTVFVDMYAVWESLSDGLKAFLEPLNAINTSALRSTSGGNIRSQYHRSMAVENTEKALEAMHPVARIHPVTGKKSLYVNSAHTKHFEDMTEEESGAVLGHLFETLKQPEFCYRHSWDANMITLWDNRCTQHYAVNDYHGQRRVMHRVTIRDDADLD